eukprot:CAMPEP_0170749640 /NCGR_PEP_ID=MMETSP0437-20130122/10502_1 /TAXON_ID=0 /ORGANISM="Sexangularia sp." /LENGTH=416 /DNA_ID=CAMNT_0011088575 /DNA_START=20 /DNA_END=1270 /DNA_ORIENTATION=+
MYPLFLTHLFFTLLSITTYLLVPPFDDSLLALQASLDTTSDRSPILPQWNWDGLHLASTHPDFYAFEHQIAFSRQVWQVWGGRGSQACANAWAWLPQPVHTTTVDSPVKPHHNFANTTISFARLLADVGPVVSLVNLAAMTLASFALSAIGHHLGLATPPLRLALALSPASVFFIASYTEPLFTAATFTGIALRMHNRPWAAALALAAATSLRSNGILGVLFLLSGAELRALVRLQRLPPLARIPQALLVMYPLVAAQVAAATLFCPGRPWCNVAPSLSTSIASLTNVSVTFPLPYTFIQSHYWGQGFLAFFRMSQLPNFLLAAPTFAFACHGIWTFSQRSRTHPDELPLYLHWAIFATICLVNTHVQTSTRFLSAACVPVYLHAAKASVWKWARYYFTVYAVLGVVLFSAFYPWV